MRETSQRAEALEGAEVLYAKEWGSTSHYGDVPRAMRDCATDLPTGACATHGLNTPRRECRLMHCLPVRRNVAVADEVLDGAAQFAVQHEARNRLTVADGGVAPNACGELLTWPAAADQDHILFFANTRPCMMIPLRSDHSLAITSLKSAAPYIRMYKGKTFVIKAGGEVFGDLDATRSLIEQIGILHYFGVRVVFVHGGGPQLTEVTEALGRADAHGGGAPHHR